MSEASTEGPARIYVGKAGDYLNNARQLVKHGVRNIAVVFHDGRFYAFDNACYHHGGALLRGDIEDMGGHPCIVCPWHSYRITMDTGEGLYVGIELDRASPTGKPKQAVKSKGKKQRVYPVTVEADGAVYIEFDASGPRVESDTYAHMAIANQEEATAAPIHGGSVAGGRGPRLHSGLGMELRSGHVFQSMHASGTGGGKGSSAFTVQGTGPHLGARAGMNPLAGLPSRAPRPVVAPSRSAEEDATPTRSEAPGPSSSMSGDVAVACSLVEDVCTDVKQFSFVCRRGAVQRHCELGEYVELELPVRDKNGRPLRRKWTVSEVNHENTLFTLIVKKAGADPAHSGSAWLHAYGLHAQLPVRCVGGTFTMVDHARRVRQCSGQVLWLTAGIGITSAFANVTSALQDGFFVHNTTEPLHVVHLHVDRHVDGVAKLPELLRLTRAFPSEHHALRGQGSGKDGGVASLGREDTGLSTPIATKSYILRLFLTQEAGTEHSTPTDSSIELDTASHASGDKRTKKEKKEKLNPSVAITAAAYLSQAPNAMVGGRRLRYEDIMHAVAEAFPDVGVGVVPFVCGPPSFVDMCTSALLSLGVPESDILTDDP